MITVGTYKFTEEDYKNFVGIIGSRNASIKEQKTAYILARKYAQKGKVVVSGLAKGIDIAAHKGSLDGKGLTVAILNTAFGESVYPKEHAETAKLISKQGCLFHPFVKALNEDRQSKELSVFQKRLIERDILLARICPIIIVIKDENTIIDGGTAWAAWYGQKLGQRVYRMDNDFKVHENPSVRKKEVWWDLELDNKG